MDQLTDAELSEEADLALQLSKDWSAQVATKATFSRKRQELTAMRRQLSERLHDYKQKLARTGRGGRWSAFLKQANFPRASADRYVKNWERTSAPLASNCLSEAITLSPDQIVSDLVQKLMPKISRLLTTSEHVELFLKHLPIVLREVPHVPEGWGSRTNARQSAGHSSFTMRLVVAVSKSSRRHEPTRQVATG